MAKSVLKSNQSHKAFHVFGLLLLLLMLMMMIQKGDAYQFKVGDSNGWTVPAAATDSNASIYNQWAEKNRFQVGDTLLFEYPADKDSVVQVTEAKYKICNATTPIAKFAANGYTVFKLNHSGPFYFVSGVEENCRKSEKLAVVVMADRSNKRSSVSNETTTIASPPPFSNDTTAATSPPSPAPAGVEYPPLAAVTVEINPSPAPSAGQTPPPPSGASAIVMGFASCMGAFLGLSLLLAF